jgi:hypothetical protein
MIRVYGTISGDPDVFIGTLEVDSDGAIKATVAGPDPRFATVLESLLDEVPAAGDPAQFLTGLPRRYFGVGVRCVEVNAAEEDEE